MEIDLRLVGPICLGLCVGGLLIFFMPPIDALEESDGSTKVQKGDKTSSTAKIVNYDEILDLVRNARDTTEANKILESRLDDEIIKKAIL